MHHVQTVEEKINKFDYAETDSIALNADEDDIYSTMVNWQEVKMKITSILSTNQQLSVSGKATGINAFQIIRNVYLLPLQANHQIFPILTTCQLFFYLRALLWKIVL